MARLPQTEIRRENLREPEAYGQLPKGEYDVIVTKTDYVTSPNGRESIQLHMTVLTGEYKDRLLLGEFCMALRLENVGDPNAERTRDIILKIGEQNLNSAMKAANLTVLNDTDNFLNKYFHVKVTQTEKNGKTHMNITYSEYKGNSYNAVPQSTPSFSNQPQGFKPPAREWGN